MFQGQAPFKAPAGAARSPASPVGSPSASPVVSGPSMYGDGKLGFSIDKISKNILRQVGKDKSCSPSAPSSERVLSTGDNTKVSCLFPAAAQFFSSKVPTGGLEPTTKHWSLPSLGSGKELWMLEFLALNLQLPLSEG